MTIDKHLSLRLKVFAFVVFLLFGATSCKKDDPQTPSQTNVIYGDTIGLPPNSMVDLDGNIYRTVLIGSQRWMTKNLKTAHYSNGDPIPYVPSNTAWAAQSSGAWSDHDNDAGYDQLTGKLYNWYTVIDPRNVCPTGWHVPTDGEWKELEETLGMPVAELDQSGSRGADINVGGMLKADGLWDSPNAGATDSVGFSALPGGNRSNDGSFFGYGSKGFWWSATAYNITFVWIRELASNNAGVYRLNTYRSIGNSIRCLED